MSNNRSTTRRARTRHSTDARYGLYPDGCVAIKVRDERGNWWVVDITWDTFDRMHQAMTAERAENQRQLDGERHNHEGTWA